MVISQRRFQFHKQFRHYAQKHNSKKKVINIMAEGEEGLELQRRERVEREDFVGIDGFPHLFFLFIEFPRF